jgi:hypothetical protein
MPHVPSTGSAGQNEIYALRLLQMHGGDDKEAVPRLVNVQIRNEHIVFGAIDLRQSIRDVPNGCDRETTVPKIGRQGQPDTFFIVYE